MSENFSENEIKDLTVQQHKDKTLPRHWLLQPAKPLRGYKSCVVHSRSPAAGISLYMCVG